MTTRDLIDRALVKAHDMAGFAGLRAADGVIEFPFATPGYPQQIIGRDVITDHLRDYPDQPCWIPCHTTESTSSPVRKR